MNGPSRRARALGCLAALALAGGCGARTGILSDDDAPPDADPPGPDADPPGPDADPPGPDADPPGPPDTWLETLTASGGVRAVAAAPGGGATLLGWAPDGVSLFVTSVGPGGEVLGSHVLRGVNVYELDAAPHPDGGFVVASDLDRGAGSGYDVWVARLDGDHRFLWQEDLTLPGDQRFAHVAVTSSGLAIVSASMMEADGSVGDVLVAAIEADGALAWQRELDAGAPILEGIRAAEDAEGVIVSSVVFDGVERSWLVALTFEGEVRWQRVIETLGDESFVVLGLRDDGRGLVLAGQYVGDAPGADCEPWVARMSPGGDLEWQWMFPDGDCGWFEWIVPDGDELVVLGDISVDLPGSPEFRFVQWLVRLDAGGRPLRQRRVDFSGSSYTFGIAESADALIFAGDAYVGTGFSAFAARVTRDGEVEGRCDAIVEADTVPVETTAVVSPFEGRLVDTSVVVSETALALEASDARAERICPQ